jgi:hypothetical protein
MKEFIVILDKYKAFKWVMPQRTPGIYFLLKEGNLVYVGKSINIHARVMQHRDIKDKDFDEVILMPVPEDELSRIENYYIGLLKPPLNKTDGEEVSDDFRRRYMQFALHNIAVLNQCLN